MWKVLTYRDTSPILMMSFESEQVAKDWLKDNGWQEDDYVGFYQKYDYKEKRFLKEELLLKEDYD